MREALVDLGAIAANIESLKIATGNLPSMVIVKANAYGHGALPVSRTAVDAGAEWLGTADLAEALELRAGGVSAPILAWLHDAEQDFSAAVEAGIDIGVSYPQQLERVAAASGRAVVQLKVDSGLGRNGADATQWIELIEAAAVHERAGRLRVRGIWSHLANAGDEADAAQISRFSEALEAARAVGLEPELVHLAATAGALRVPAARFNLVRLGIGVYGLEPDDGFLPELRPAMELAAGVVAVKRVPAGHGVSYGFDYVTSAPTTLALVPLGYADGIPRHASGKGEVSIDGMRYPVAGRIAMDQIVVDVGAEHPVAVGDRVVVFGDGRTGVPTARDWADWADTINYEIVTRIGPRVARRYR
jgi:alanine racemase